MRGWRVWVLACRPVTLVAALVPVWVGAACAYAAGETRWAGGIAAAVGAALLQIAANLANDVFDFEKGADTAERLGPLRVTQSGLLTPRAVRRALALVLAAAIGVGAYLAWLSGPAIVVMGLASIVAALAYTGGPYPLAYHGLGDLFVMIFFGFVAVAGTAFVVLGRVPSAAWWAATAVGSMTTLLLVVNNVRDEVTDRLARKRTLVARFGRRFGLAEYASLLALGYGSLLGLTFVEDLGVGALLPLVTLPLSLRNLRALKVRHGRDLNPLLGATARVLGLFGLLLGVGIGLGAMP